METHPRSVKYKRARQKANSYQLKTDFPREFRVVFPRAVKHATVTCDGQRLAPAHVKVSKDTVTFSAQAARAYRVSGI
jgi:hypothetical protein